MAHEDIPEFPIPCGLWAQLVKVLDLPPKQIRIVELILRDYCDKEIAAALGLKVPTIRTYLQRIYQRMGVGNRVELILRIVAMSHGNHHHRQ